MPYLLGQQRIRAYGSYNSQKNSFMLNAINNGSCWMPRQARCQAPCGAFYPDKSSDETANQYLEKYCGWVKERKNTIKNTDNKRISDTVRVSSSEYQMNKASGVSTQSILFNRLQPKPGYERNDLDLLQWNQSSDRAFPSRMKRYNKVNVPSHGNSTKTSLTRHRPGSGAGGKQDGVDLKHNSYHRYLLKKKGLKPLRGEKKSKTLTLTGTNKQRFEKSVQNNKWKKDSIVANMNLCLEECRPKPKPAPEIKPEIKPEVKPEDLLKVLSSNNYMELTGGEGTIDEPFTGRSTNHQHADQTTRSRAIITFKAEHPSQVTVNIESSSEYLYDAVFLLKNDEIISLGTENNGNPTGININNIPRTMVGTNPTSSPPIRRDFVYKRGQSGNNQESLITLVVDVEDEIKIMYDKDYGASWYEDAITEFSVYAEPLTSHKELPKSIVQEEDFFKTSLKEIEPKKAPEDFFNINKFDYTVKSKDTIERIKDYTLLKILITDLDNAENFFESQPYISYIDNNNKNVDVKLKELINGSEIKIKNPVSFKFRSILASFDVTYKNREWQCNPPVSKHMKDIFVFDKLQNLTLVVKVAQ